MDSRGNTGLSNSTESLGHSVCAIRALQCALSSRPKWQDDHVVLPTVPPLSFAPNFQLHFFSLNWPVKVLQD